MTPPKDGARPRVLVVDDNGALVENLIEILSESGYEVTSAASCGMARAALHRGFDIGLVDVKLPDGDGTALAAELKEARPESEIVLLTGFASIESAAAAVRAGACAYLVKPCATPELLLTVEQALRQVRLHADKRELARRAQVAEKLAAVGTLTAGLSHEIRNPLNAAGLQLTVLARRVQKLPREEQPALMEPLALVRDEIQRLNHILEDFLRFARPQELSMARVDMGVLVASTVELLRGDAERREISLELSLDEARSCPPVAGDENRLRQVMMNLVLNALDAAGKGGRVRVGALAEAHGVVVTIDDSGSGVAPELRDRIFEPFFTTKASGSGLGLPIVNAIIVQHGGQIAIGTGPLGGAQFSVRLPRWE